MTWLAEWLREIVFVVLVAIFIELLLPNRSMERYVRLVISLLILMTLLSPLLKLFSEQPTEKLKMVLAEQTPERNGSLEEILRRGEELRLTKQQDTTKWASKETAEQMKRQIEAGTELEVDKVAVTIKVVRKTSKENEPEYDQPVITSVKVYLAQKPKPKPESLGSEPDTQSSSPSRKSVTVEQVKPIEVNVGQVSRTSPPSEGSDLNKELKGEGPSEDETDQNAEPVLGDQLTTETGAVAKRIYQILGSSWGIEKDSITVFKASDNVKLERR